MLLLKMYVDDLVWIRCCSSDCVFQILLVFFFVFFFKQKTAYEMRISDWSSDVCSSDLCSTPSAPRSRSGRTRSRPTSRTRASSARCWLPSANCGRSRPHPAPTTPNEWPSSTPKSPPWPPSPPKEPRRGTREKHCRPRGANTPRPSTKQTTDDPHRPP